MSAPTWRTVCAGRWWMRLQAMGIDVEASHHEVANGQSEIDFKYGPALVTADNANTMRTTLKAVAQKNGLHCTFMPKPIAGVSGSGMHVHQSLWNRRTGDTAMYDADSEYGLSRSGAALYCRPAGTCQGDHADHCAAGQQLQAPGRRLRGAGLHFLGAHQSQRA